MLRKELNRIWASSPDAGVSALTNAKYSLGWVSEIPAYQHLNWLHQQLDTNQLALAERGVFEWGTDVSYKKGGLTWQEADGFIYIALVANPTTTPPSNQWTRSAVQVPRQDWEDLVANWNTHITNLNNPHGVTAIQAGAVPATGGTYTGTVTFPQLGFGTASFLFDDGDGSSWAKDGVKLLNISPTGIARTFFDGVWRELLHEGNYVAYRTDVEPKFALPEPDFFASLTSSIFPENAMGNQYVEFTRAASQNYNNKLGQLSSAGIDTPVFGKYGLAALNGVSAVVSGLPLPDKTFSMAITLRMENDLPFGSVGVNKVFRTLNFSNTSPASGLAVQIKTLSATESELIIVCNDARYAAVDISNISTVKLLLVGDGARVTLYINGVAKENFDANAFTINGNNINLGYAANNIDNLQLSNFKFWGYPLTRQQAMAY